MLDILDIPGTMTGYVFGALLLVIRLSSLLVMVPGFRRQGLPMRFRVAVSIVLALIMDIALGGVFVPFPEDLFSPVVLVFREFLIGTTMGMVIRLMIAALEGAGAAASYSMALSLNVFVDPSSGEQTMSMGSLFGVAGALIFIALDGHHVVIQTFFAHLKEFPVGEAKVYFPSITTIGSAGVDLFSTAFLLASPAIVITLAINIGLAFVMRVVPSVNIFGIGLSLLIMGGFLVLAFEGDAVIQHIDRSVQMLPENMVEMTGAIPAEQ